MTIARKGLRAPQAPAHTRTRSAIVVLITILASGGCAKQDSAPPTASADATATQSSATVPTEQPAAEPANTIPEPFHGIWASTEDTCQLIQTEGLEPAVTITASEIRDVEYETFCTLHKVVSASATELVAEFICPTVDDQTPAPAQRTLALAAGRLVFQDRSVSYLRCAGEAPAPPVELAEPIEAPPATTPAERTLPASGESDVTRPRIASSTQPDYPEASRRAGEQGSVTLDALVSDDRWRASDVRIAKSSGSEALDQAAVTEVATKLDVPPGQGARRAYRRCGHVSRASTFKLTDEESAPAGTAGSPSVYRRCLSDPAGPKAFTRLRLNRMGAYAYALDEYSNGQYDQYFAHEPVVQLYGAQSQRAPRTASAASQTSFPSKPWSRRCGNCRAR